MESTHDLHSIQAIARNRKSAAFLYPDKDILKEQSATAQKLHAQEFDSKHFKKLNSVSPLSGELNSAKQSTFAPIQSKTTDEDESVVSSTTNETKIERSTPPGDSTSIFNPRPLLPEELKSYRPPGRPRKATETAAASSTTTLEDDNQRLQMQDTTGRERHKNSNQRDHDTLLGSSKELQPSSTTHEDIVMREKSNNSNSIHQNRGVFLKPTDLPAKSRPMRSTGQPHTLENAVEGGESDAEAARLRQTLPPGVPEQHVKDGRSQFDTRQMHMQLGQNLNRSPILSDVSLIPMSPQQIPGMGGPNQFNPNSSFDLYMSGFSSPTMSVLSQARNLSPRHSIQDLEKINQSFYGSPFNMAQVPTGHQAHMNSFPGGFPSQGMNPLAYYQFLQHQQKLLGMSLEKPDEMGRFPSPLCRSRARKRPLSISPAFSDTLDINAMIRTSPNSLLPYVNGAGLGHSRCSSAASGGSYGHLVSGGISPNGYLSGYNTPSLTSPPLQLLSRQMSMPGYMPGMQQMGSSLEKMDTTMPNPFHHMNMAQRGYSQHSGFQATGKNPNAPLGQNGTETKNRTKNHSDMLNSSMQVNRSTTNNGVPSGTGNDDNEIVYETNCQWENCSKEFDTQEQLVQHINNDHIHGDKKEFACHWKDCAREKRPFKAQYMLVVHMRRHTGEKPHKCTFKDCAKAYSRLENLKTHLRSHTGEKPYVCEFPSCTKAFSNASDRAKHQNRTHSNEKPYVCKITGCTKRYTDPSSLRKHVKTVHGPDAHVTKRMKAIREREEKKSEINVKQEPGLEKEKKKNENDQSKKNCHSKTITSGQHNTDSNPPGSMNPRSNQSSYTSGSDVTPQNSPHMTSQNNDSGVDVNVGGNDADSDGDIIVDENPLPDSTSGGVSVQSRVRADVRPSMISKHFNKKMATLSLAGTPHDIDGMFTDYPRRNVESPLSMNERNSKQGGTEVSSTTLNRKLQRVKNYIMNNSVSKHRHVALINNDRRDSGTVSDVSRKSSSASQYSRKSSQISNAGINVAGSYDPISLDSSRRSSSNSTTAAMKYSGSNSNAPCLNPYDLHHLQSKFSEIAGLPPPTPINGEPYSRQQNFLKPNDDGYHHMPYQQGTNMQNRSNTFLPKPPKEGAKKGEGARRRSEDLYVRSKKTSQPGDSLGPINRRASDPVPKSNQIDPSKLPSIQKHDSWSNMAPLPSIQSRNSNLNDSTSHYNSYAPVQRNMPRSNSSSNFFGNANQNLAASQQHHQANFDQQMYRPHSDANNQAMMNNMSVDVMPACQPQYHQQSNYVNHLSPAGNMASQSSKAMSPMSPHRSEMMQLSPMAYQNPAITPPMSHPHLNNQPIKGNHVMLPHPINSYPEHSDQQHYYNNNNMQFASNPMYSNQQMAMHSHMANQQLYEMQQNNFTPQPFNSYNDNHQMNSWNSHAPHMQFHQAQQQNNGMQNHYPNMSHFVPPTSIPDQRPNNMMPNPNPPFTSEETITPRPPSHSSSSTSNRLRMTRLRHTNSAQNQPSVIESHPTGSGSYGRPTPRVNCTPDAQIPDDFLEQEFIDSIPELQPDAINSANHNNSYIKMPADSTTGPDGDMGGDIDDAMSTTNTDVTLPPMSAFSSRMATPLMNKPYPPHPMPGSAQHPASNMAISSMSSMLSTLEEENKYLSMMPPQ